MRSALASGFTLIELLVVIALTSILLILIFKPLIDAFNLTSRAGTSIESQTAAREMMRQVSAEITNAVFVYDNANPRSLINVWVYDSAGAPALTQVPFGMVEFVAPSRQLDQAIGNKGPIDPTTGEPIYSPTLPPGQRGYSLPLERGSTITRYFIGLHDNRSGVDTHAANGYTSDPGHQSGMPVDSNGNYHGYANRWTDPKLTSQDNRYTLYKAQVLAYISNPGNPSNFIPNLELFHTGPDPTNPTNITNSEKDLPILDDPNFFYDTSLAGPSDDPTYPPGDPHWAVPGWKDVNGDGKVEIWENWRAVASTMLQTDKADTIGLDRDTNGNILYYDNQNNLITGGTGRPIARPLIRFAPSYIENDPAVPTSLQATGAEVPFTAAPSFTLQHGAMGGPFRVFVYQNNNPTDWTTIDPNLVNNQVRDPLTPDPINNVFTYYQYDSLTGAITYHDANPPNNTDVGPRPNPITGFWQNPNPQYAFTVNRDTGVVNFSFPQWVTVNDGTNRLPQRYSPVDINNTLTAAQNNIGKRYIVLGYVLSTANYTYSDPILNPGAPPYAHPLNPATNLSPLNITNFVVDPTVPGNDPNLAVGGTHPQKVQIVPGSERVYGPDQRPGPHYGWRIQYTRVPSLTATPGPNQYRINYQPGANAQNDSLQGDPAMQTGYIEFNSLPDAQSLPNMPMAPAQGGEDPLNHIYRPNGLPELKFDPASNQDVPADLVEVEYQFQTNRPSDVVKSDYLTRELMDLVLDIRLFDPATTTAQDTTLTEKVKIRNLQR